MNKTWELEDHLCKVCGGRILRCASGAGPSPGGNPLYRCADCGVATTSMGPGALCWCGFGHRMQNDGAYSCVPFSILRDRPDLLSAFRSCGCEPGRSEVGIMLSKDLHAKKEAS